MPTNSVIVDSDVSTIIPIETSNILLGEIAEQSAVMRMGRRLRNMVGNQFQMPVLSGLASAFFVNGETGLKQTTKNLWANRIITAEEIAVIVPVAQSTFDDSTVDLWEQIRPDLVTAIGEAIDSAVLFETDKPASWPTGIVAGATAAGHTVALGSLADLYDEILGEDGTIAFIEQDGFMHNGHYAHLSMRSKLRGVRDADGNPIFSTGLQDAQSYFLDGSSISFPTNGAPLAAFPLISGDWQQLVYSVRQEMTFTTSVDGVITDNMGNIIHNLFQQDMIALRVVIRLGFQLPNKVNRVNQNDVTRYPFAILTN